jgi:hypothetical protein
MARTTTEQMTLGGAGYTPQVENGHEEPTLPFNSRVLALGRHFPALLRCRWTAFLKRTA